MPFGQLVIGPPGSGKTTYCLGISEYLKSIGRDVAIINLDPANECVPYECNVNISDLVCVEEVQEQMGLGPNGGLIYCMDYLASNMDWLQVRIIHRKVVTLWSVVRIQCFPRPREQLECTLLEGYRTLYL